MAGGELAGVEGAGPAKDPYLALEVHNLVGQHLPLIELLMVPLHIDLSYHTHTTHPNHTTVKVKNTPSILMGDVARGPIKIMGHDGS